MFFYQICLSYIKLWSCENRIVFINWDCVLYTLPQKMCSQKNSLYIKRTFCNDGDGCLFSLFSNVRKYNVVL
jgi:hypothetical protein